ncbi:MAG: hypothetical protein QOF42_54 [Gammaproteobacteria bacterium]|jgi:hypothetical protein|nr:hypothetical protein [Gammaproteobacteria bacterium]
MAALKLLERTLVFEENDFAVGLSASLKSGTYEIHRSVAGQRTLHIDAALAVRGAYYEARTAHGWEYRVGVRFFEKRAACAGLFEGVN